MTSWGDWDFKGDESLKGRISTKIRRAKNYFSNLYYEARAVFFPYNVVKIQNCPRTWSDRDNILFHAMFQVLVDYIELEQPYVDWGFKEKGRLTDVCAHALGMEKRYNPKLQDMDDINGMGAEYYERAYPDHQAIIDLYRWYKHREWDKDFVEWEDEKAHKALCDSKLIEIVKYRSHYWT